MSSRYVCIHGHFYQPPRENAWSGEVERQPSAAPWHDWNERITEECYAANAASRIEPDADRGDTVNNYAWISSNFGPTLLSWLERHAGPTYRAVLEADPISAARYGGHGAALAQVYNHVIMPLANGPDRRTQVLWGIADFEHRFRRRPAGMWLAETAVSTPVLEELAACGIGFTILAPHQARRVRTRGDDSWHEIEGESIDPSRAYRCRLPSGRSIALFFYDGPISRGVAFEGLLEDGDRLARRLLAGFDPQRRHSQLVHVATDGETYGHHHRHGEQALTRAIAALRERDDVQWIDHAAFLELHPPDHEVEIVEDSSWSCPHGVERWRSDCGCSTGSHPGWSQAWRAPLRESLDWLRDSLALRFEREAGRLLRDPWRARDDFVEVLLDRDPDARDAFFTRQARPRLGDGQRERALRLLELQRQLMLMFTSCGWFFDDLARIETVQILQYAARAMDLARELLGVDLRQGFLGRLDRAASNDPARGSGRRVFESMVEPRRRPVRLPWEA